MSTLFISHSSRDGAQAAELKKRLHERKHRAVFLDFDPDDGIHAGTSWERTLYTKLRSCRAVVALCSENYLTSHWCFAEIALARMEGKHLFALQIDPWGHGTKLPSILTEDQYIDLRIDPEAGYERLWRGFDVKGLVPEERRQLPPGRCPYPGLRAFDEVDESIFFGRDREVSEGVELLNRMRRQGHPRLMMVLGSSGSGKSSLTRAGIVPRLRREEDRWLPVGPFRPGREPARELALAFAREFARIGRPRPPQELAARLDPATPDRGGAGGEGADESKSGQERLSAREMLRIGLERMVAELTLEDANLAEAVGRLREHLASSPEDPRPVPGGLRASSNPLAALAAELRLESELSEAKVVLVIDQFEELLGLDHGDDHPANRFLKLLKAGIEADDGPPIALGAMRSDFLGILQRSGPLRGVGFKSLSVGPMSEEGMMQVIEQPAMLGQIDLEKPDLTRRLLRETGTADALPLLAFTLRAMWDRYHETRRFDVQGYEALGGLQGAIAQVADDTLEAALAKSDAGAEKDLRIAFLSLARPAAEGSGWSRRPVSWEEMPARVRPMIQQFVDQRLLVKRADGTVEVAHEALFRSWEKLRGWLNANAEGLHLLREIRVDAEKWQRAETREDKKEYQWGGGRLARALELRERGVLQLEELDRSFIDHSEAAEVATIAAKRRRQRRILASVVSAAVVFLALAAWAFRESLRAERKATEMHAGLVVRTSSTLRDPLVRALLLIESAQILPDAEPAGGARAARSALGEATPRSVLRGHRAQVSSVVFSPDDQRILTASNDGTARVWRRDGTGQPVTLEGPGGELASARFDDPGERVVLASRDGKASVWQADGLGEPIVLEGHRGALWSAEFSHDGTRVVTASGDRTARVWTLDGSAEPVVLEGHGDEVRWAGFSRGDATVLTVSQDGEVRAWSPVDPADWRVLTRHSDWIQAARFDRGATRIVTASKDQTARVCPVSGAEPCAVLKGHKGWLWSANFSRDGTRVVTASTDRTARVWRADGSGEPIVLEGHQDWVRDAIFSPDGRSVLTTSGDGDARLWKLDSSGASIVLKGHEGWVRTGAFSHDGKLAATASDDQTVRIWATEGPSDPRILRGHRDQVWTAAFNDDDSRIVTGSADRTARIWDSESLRTLAVLEGHQDRLRAAEFSVDSTVVTASDDRTARLWSTSGGPAQRIFQHPDKVFDVNFSHDGKKVVTTCFDRRVRVWSIDGELLESLVGHTNFVRSAVFSQDNSKILSGAADNTARIWRADGAGEPQILRGHLDQVMTAAFDQAGSRIVTASADRTARVVPVDGSAEAVVLEGHEAIVWNASFNPDGSKVVTASQDGTARVWQADGSGEPIYLEGHGAPVWQASFSRDGSQILTASADGTARLWSLWQQEWPALVEDLRRQTNACLMPKLRVRHLVETPEQAAARHAECERSQGRPTPSNSRPGG